MIGILRTIENSKKGYRLVSNEILEYNWANTKVEVKEEENICW